MWHERSRLANRLSSGYFDHQIVSGMPSPASRAYSNRVRWSYDRIRVTYSAVEHIDVVRALFPGDSAGWEISPPAPTTPPFATVMSAQDGLAFLSWLSSETVPSTFPSFLGSTIIPRIVGFLRRQIEAIAPAPPAEEQPQPGFAVRLNIGSVEHAFEPKDMIRYVFQASAILPEVSPHSPARLILRIVPKIPEGNDFLNLCMRSSAAEEPGSVTLIGAHQVLWPEDLLLSLLEMEVEVVRREWIVPAHMA